MAKTEAPPAKDQPAMKIRIGNVVASIWRNEGNKSFFYGVTISKNYKDGNDTWKSTDNLGHGDLLNAVEVLRRAEAWISSQE